MFPFVFVPLFDRGFREKTLFDLWERLEFNANKNVREPLGLALGPTEVNTGITAVCHLHEGRNV